MTQMDIYSMVDGDVRDPERALKKDVVAKYARAGVGSILNAPFNGHVTDGRTGWSAPEWRRIIEQIQDVYREHNQVPMLYGIDTIHGATYVRGATLFGQPISAASSFNPDLVYQMGEIEAKDTQRAGIPWVFSPVLGIAVQPKWARVFETFGEDPHLASVMGASIIRGIQSSGKVAACMKHFIGYSNPTSGLDRADNVIPDWDLVNLFAPSFLAATRAGVKTAMESYNSINGFPVIASHKLLSDLLRHDMNFTGMLVSDYSEIDRMHQEHHLVPTVADAVRVSLSETSLDMNMSPNMDAFLDTVEALVKRGDLSESRLDESVSRILSLKKDLGLFRESKERESMWQHERAQHEHQRSPTASANRGPPAPMTTAGDRVGSPEDQQVALKLARESVILLENRNDTLPLRIAASPATSSMAASRERAEPTTVFVTGPISDNKGYMCGGWSVFWQGSSNSSHFPNGKTFKEAVFGRRSERLHAEHLNAVDVDGKIVSDDEYANALQIAARSEYTLVVLGEGNYAEKTGDIADLSLPSGQRRYLKALTAIRSTKVIVVLVSGRPRLLHGAHKDAAAVLLSMLPCEQGGEALADVIFGDTNPSAKLPITYPLADGKVLPYFHRVNTMCQPWIECPVEWEFGYGLSYSRFRYSDLAVNATQVQGSRGALEVSVTLENPSSRAGSEAVLLFVAQSYRLAAVPERKLLKQFRKVHLAARTRTSVVFVLTLEDWSFYAPRIGTGFTRSFEAGEFTVSVLQSTNADGVASVESGRGRDDAGGDSSSSSMPGRGGGGRTTASEGHRDTWRAKTTSLSATFRVIA
ncbi:hypothetical protein PybrP1_005902 [[Pythium] brassicae (nom. inval.)]|nr:hypothetical protein PybrP1_005902 [[Pythium] brassicae (nom. inval.)]